MASAELLRLWKLHEIDSRIHDIRTQAANLNPTKRFAKPLAEAEANLAAAQAAFDRIHGERNALEELLAGATQAIAQHEKRLYDGSVTNPKDVEIIERDLASQRAQRETAEFKLTTVRPEAEAARAELDAAVAALAAVKKQLGKAAKEALAAKESLEQEFKALREQRPAATQGIGPALMAKYDAIRGKYGTGMAKVLAMNCGTCGMAISERAVNQLRDDRTVTCEACHRLLYFSTGLV
ncbi:MAG: hypothetical protein SFX74_00975 [Fimbriimonadaceae bacterium]|nr:hypothetical protein [Fimbriimonadaceae bacterium]